MFHAKDAFLLLALSPIIYSTAVLRGWKCIDHLLCFTFSFVQWSFDLSTEGLKILKKKYTSVIIKFINYFNFLFYTKKNRYAERSFLDVRDTIWYDLLFYIFTLHLFYSRLIESRTNERTNVRLKSFLLSIVSFLSICVCCLFILMILLLHYVRRTRQKIR